VSLHAGSEIGPYRLLTPIGQGGMARVYRAFQPSLRRDVAIKVIGTHLADQPAFRARFRREAEVLAQLEHPNILPVFDYGELQGEAYIVYRYIAGGELKDLLGQALPLAAVVRLLTPVAAALDFAHAQGIVHRDVKPSNILLTADRTPIVADFGLARIFSTAQRGDAAEALTESSVSIGTPAYMAPEQVLGEPLDGRADQYALGIIAFQMLTGTVPFAAETPLAIALQQVHEPPPLPSARNADISAAVEQALLIVLAKDPDARYASCGAFIAALAAAHAPASDSSSTRYVASPRTLSGAAPAGPASPHAAPAPPQRAQRIIVATLVAALVLGVVAVSVALVTRGRGGGLRAQQAATVHAPAAALQTAEPGGAPSPATPAGAALGGIAVQVIFGDRLRNGWTNDTDRTRASIQLPGAVQHGTHPALNVRTLAPYAGLRLVTSGVPTTGFTHLRFFVHLEQPTAALDGYVSGAIGGRDREGTTITSTAVARSDEGDGWTRVDVPLIWIGLDTGSLTALSFDSNTDQTGVSFDVADIELVTLSPPTPGAAQAGRVRFIATSDGKPVAGVVVLLSTGARYSTDAAGQVVFEDIPRGPLDYRVTFPDSFEGSPLVDHDEGELTVKAGATSDQPVTVVKADLQVDAPTNDALVALPVTLRWRAYPSAAGYQVEIDPDGPGEAIMRDTTQVSLAVDASLQPQTRYTYHVTAVNAAGVVIAQSDTQSFRTP
jgi:tRNA A-37 threonylcarbamoyl transferase component Bud32